jgi:hypothetical protein
VSIQGRREQNHHQVWYLVGLATGLATGDFVGLGISVVFCATDIDFADCLCDVHLLPSWAMKEDGGTSPAATED